MSAGLGFTVDAAHVIKVVIDYSEKYKHAAETLGDRAQFLQDLFLMWKMFLGLWRDDGEAYPFETYQAIWGVDGSLHLYIGCWWLK